MSAPDMKHNPLEFHYDPSPQRSPEWLAIKRGKIGTSRLGDWLAVSKSKTGPGKPLKARLDYEKELMFERQFGVSFNTYVTDAMQDGIDFEDFARKQYEIITDSKCVECGCWYNDFLVASPDRLVNNNTLKCVDCGKLTTPEEASSRKFNTEQCAHCNGELVFDEGSIEIKIVKDNTFTEVLMSGVPDKHWKQMQGQLWANKRVWCDYVCVNFTSKKLVIIRVYPDTEFHKYLELAVQEELVTEPFALTNVHDIVGELPDWSRNASAATVGRSDSNIRMNGW